MNKLLMKAIEWMRSRVTAFKSEKLRVKSEKVKDTLCVYADDDENENLQKVKEASLNPKLSTLNQAKLRLTIPEVEQLLRAKYDLRYNLLTEQSEYRVKGSDAAYEAVTQRVYKTWMADL